MEVEYLKQIGLFKNAFSKKYCQDIINLFEDNIEKSFDRTSQGYNPYEVQDRNLDLLQIPEGEEFIKTFQKVFFKAFYDYSIKYTSPMNVFPHGFKIQKTRPSEGYHSFHSEYPYELTKKDTEMFIFEKHGLKVNDYHRIAAYTLYLNDIELGGETEFLHQSMRISPQEGCLCIFPSFYTHSHRGNTPLKGTKYILTGWIYLHPVETQD